MARKERLTVFIAGELIEDIRICAVRKRKRVSDVVAMALREYLSKTHCRDGENTNIESDDNGGEE